MIPVKFINIFPHVPIFTKVVLYHTYLKVKRRKIYLSFIIIFPLRTFSRYRCPSTWGLGNMELRRNTWKNPTAPSKLGN